MKKYLVSQLAPGVHAAAIYDEATWGMPNYTNFYILQRKQQTVLIDAGMKSYAGEMTAILREIGLEAQNITHVLLTHGHHDHADGAKAFHAAEKYVHNLDAPVLGSSLAAQFSRYQTVEEFSLCAPSIPDLDIVLVNSHTPGSVAIYDQASKALFVGDFFCFFGEELPEGQLVSYGRQSREESYQYVADQAVESSADSARFLQGLSRLLAYHPEFLCTGHGVILQGDIHEFLTKLWKSGQGARS